MGKKKAAAEENSTTQNVEKEGHNLLGKPKFKKLENGRLRCVATGHELPAHSKESYSQTKHCRVGLIDSALAKRKPPLNMFEQDPSCRMKLICNLTGDIINKSEEHIWKHINGKRFLNMLEKKEAEKEEPEIEIVKEDEIEIVTEQDEENAKKEKERKKKKKKEKMKAERKLKKEKKVIEEAENDVDEINVVKESEENGGDMEKEEDFWMPPAGERWDQDDGGDRWDSDTDSGSEDDNAVEEDVAVEDVVEEAEHDEAHKLSKKTKRMSLETGPSSFASKKKKRKTSAVSDI